VLALCRFLPATTERKDGTPLTVRIPAGRYTEAREFNPSCNWLSLIWRAITGDSYIVRVDYVGTFETFDYEKLQKTLMEVVKYPFKFPGAERIEELEPEERHNLGEGYFPVEGMANLYETFAGRRSVWSTGLLRGLLPEPGTPEYYVLLASWCQNCSSGLFKLDYIAPPASWITTGNEQLRTESHKRQGVTRVTPKIDLAYVEMARALQRGEDLETAARRYWKRQLRYDSAASLELARGAAELTVERLRAPALHAPGAWSESEENEYIF
jgi:hypothetical protein